MAKLTIDRGTTYTINFEYQRNGVATIPMGFHGFRFALGLGIAITRNAVYTDTTAIGAGEVKVKLSRTV